MVYRDCNASLVQNALSGELCAKEVVNSDQVKRHRVVCCNQVQAPSGGKSCVQRSTKLRNDIRGKKVKVHKVGCTEELDMPMSDMRGSTE